MEQNLPKHTELLGRIEALEVANSAMVDDVALLKGILQVHDKQIIHNKDKIVDLTAHSMSNNLLIYGLEQEEEELCLTKVREFLREKLKLNFEDKEVIVAHRMGSKQEGKFQPMVVRCQPKLKNNVLKNSYKLKDQKNSREGTFTVRPQLPEPLLTEKKEREDKLRKIKKQNETIPEEQKELRKKAYIKKGKLFINDQPYKTYVRPPTVADILNSNKQDQEKMNLLKFAHSTALIEWNSVFQGHTIRVKNSVEVKLAYCRLHQLYPESDHVMMAYCARGYSGYQDHGQYGAGKRLEQLLLSSNRKDLAIFVTRDFGGTHLGQRRFLLIERVAKEAINQMDEMC